MIKVLGPSKEVVSHIDCQRCSVMLEYTNDDVQKHIDPPDIFGWPNTTKYIICPQCRSDVVIEMI